MFRRLAIVAAEGLAALIDGALYALGDLIDHVLDPRPAHA